MGKVPVAVFRCLISVVLFTVVFTPVSKAQKKPSKIISNDSLRKAEEKLRSYYENNKNGALEEVIKKTDQFRDAEKAIDKGLNDLKNMPYPEFEAKVMKLQPNLSKREIKEAYNKMHLNDGKQVKITEADNVLTPEQQMLWAIKAIEQPKSYEEFEKAAKILNPKISEEKLRQGWDKAKNK